MATVRVCTDGGQCIECSGTAEGTVADIQRNLGKGLKWFCCGTECIRADAIVTVKEVARLPDDDDGGGGGPIVVGNPDVVIITGGQTLLSRRTPQPVAGPRWIGGEEGPGEPRFES